VTVSLAIAAALAGLAFLAGRYLAPPAASATHARQGWLFAGGKIAHDLPGSPMVGQLYAEYQLPAARRHRYPVVMIHGGRQTGTNFTGTPDGREGWAQYFVREGFAVYVVDAPGRGRAAYNRDAYGPLRPLDHEFALRQFVAPERYALWPQAHLHSQWPGEAVPGDRTFDAFMASQQPGIADFALQQELMRDACAALLDEIGPAILLVHSQAGAFAWPVAQARPGIVKAILAIEPSGPPVHDIVALGAPEWFRDDARVKISGLGDLALAYAPAPAPGEELAFVRAPAEGPDLPRCWLQQEPARRLVGLDSIPVLLVSGEASYHASYDHCTAAYLQQAGVEVDHVRLADVGIRGNGHMMMQEKNSDEIAELLVRWLSRRQF